MKKLIRQLNNVFTTCLLSLWALAAQAQEDFDDVLDIGPRRSIDDGIDDKNLDLEERYGLRLSDFFDELLVIGLLLVAIAITRHFISKRHRKGCTFFLIIFAAAVYFINKFL